MRLPPVLIAVVLLATAACSSTGDAAAPDAAAPTTTAAVLGPPIDVQVDGPITGGARGLAYNSMPEGYAERYGYTEEEWFVSGEATSYAPTGELTADGEWTVAAADTAPYTTRILVRRPVDPADFNGVVVVEWNNVTAGRDSDPGFGFLHPELLAEGYAYVGVSAQAAGIAGDDALFEIPGAPPEATQPLQVWDPERYAPLSHPGDDYSYDIFSQVGAIAEGRASTNPLDGLEPTTVIALGESLSAGRLVSYLNAVQPLAETYDGVMVHSRGGGAAPIAEAAASAPPAATIVRTDLDIPVLIFETETDFTFLGFFPARQPDTDRVRTWEVAGTAHADQSTLDYGIASGLRWSDAGSDIGATLTETCGIANDGPQAEVARAAFAALSSWVLDGTPPPTAAPLETTADGALVRDDDGNALGGIRTPAVDVPISTLTGVGNPSSVFCSLFGQEVPFTAETLATRYPTHDAYVDAVTASADAALERGFLLQPDRDAIVSTAEESPIGE